MNSADVKHMILEEIGSARTNKFGWDFRGHLLDEPELHEYREPDGSLISYWCVFREPDDGYLIVYDEEMQMFGLVSSNTAVAWYSTFMNVLDGM
jgi:hypothetical protein